MIWTDDNEPSLLEGCLSLGDRPAIEYDDDDDGRCKFIDGVACFKLLFGCGLWVRFSRVCTGDGIVIVVAANVQCLPVVVDAGTTVFTLVVLLLAVWKPDPAIPVAISPIPIPINDVCSLFVGKGFKLHNSLSSVFVLSLRTSFVDADLNLFMIGGVFNWLERRLWRWLCRWKLWHREHVVLKLLLLLLLRVLLPQLLPPLQVLQLLGWRHIIVILPLLLLLVSNWFTVW